MVGKEVEDGNQKKNPHDEKHFFGMEVAASLRKMSPSLNCFCKLKMRQF